VQRNKEGKLRKEEFGNLKEHNVLHVTGKFLQINNVSRKYFKPRVSWCKVNEGVMSCKLGILTEWINYVSNLLNWLSNAKFISDRVASVEIRNCDNC
jgi:hypothetical protein